MGDYWSFNLAGSFLPIILLRNEVDSGTGTVTKTYRHYVYIYSPGILGADLTLISVQLPIVGRNWSLVFSAICQGLSMVVHAQVYTKSWLCWTECAGIHQADCEWPSYNRCLCVC